MLCVCVYSRAAAVFVGQLGSAVSFCLWAKASAHRGSSRALLGPGSARGKVGTGETGVVLEREFSALCTATQKSLLGGLVLALQPFKILCSLERRMWVQEERKWEGLSPGGAVSCSQASLSTSKFLSSCVGSARKDSFVGEAQRILSMLGSNVLLVPILTYHSMCLHSMQVWRTKYPDNWSQKCRGNLSEDAFCSNRMKWDVIHSCGLHIAELLSP